MSMAKSTMKIKLPLVYIVTGMISLLLSYGMGMEQQEITCIHDQIAESNPYKVNISSHNEELHKRQASADYSSIRIHPVFVNVTSSAQAYVQAPNGPLFNSITTLAELLMVQPVQGNFVIPPMCSEYTFGPNEGKCRAPLRSQDSYRCGEFGIIPTEYIGTREVCETSDQTECPQDGPGGAGIPDTDYLLFVSATYTSICGTSTLAYASTCMVDISDNGRPVAGYINICPLALTTYGDQESIVYGLFMHEIIHALGFSRRLFDQYVNEDGVTYSPVRSQSGPYGGEDVFTGPKTAELAKQYYACDEIDGLLLENQGGSGTRSSHWEKRILNHAVMNGYISSDYLVLSQFTIALLEDSGWYKGNYTALEMLNQFPLQWGKGLGCSFLSQQCINKTVYPYLCDGSIDPSEEQFLMRRGRSTCTYDHLSKGTCSRSWAGFDGCPVVLADIGEGYCRTDINMTFNTEIERYGSSSICVDTARAQTVSCGTYITSPSPICVSQLTYTVNNSSQYILQLQNESYSCKDDHSLITDNGWIVSCPPADVVTSVSAAFSGELPVLSSTTIIELNSSVYDLDEGYINVEEIDLEVFGELNFLYNSQTAVYYVNSLINCTVFVCRQFVQFASATRPVEVSQERTVRLSGVSIYSVRKDEVAASLGLYDYRTQTQDFSLALMLDPQADHSFVYYAASVDIVGEYLESIYSSNVSFFTITALANNTVIRIAPSKTISIGDINISYGEEHAVILNYTDTLMVSSNDDLTGSRVTANKAITFYSGLYCTSVRNTNCSILTEQIPPYNSWGNTFILHTNISGLRGNMFKIIASDVGANVSINCTTDGTDYEVNNYNLGFRQHSVISVIHDYCIVDSDEDILMIQFKDGSQPLQDTFMTILPALDHLRTKYAFEVYDRFEAYVVMTVENIDPHTVTLLHNGNPLVLEWEPVEMNKNTYYFSILVLSSMSFSSKQTLEFSRNDIKFGAMLYGVSLRENNIDTFALPSGLALEVREDLPIQVPSPVQNTLVTVIDEMISVTWLPPANPNGVIHQYIVRRINSSGTLYYHVPGNQHHLLLPYLDDAVVFVSPVNLFGQGEFEYAKPNEPCLPNPCTNNGICVVANATDQQLLCDCVGMHSGIFCENSDKLYPFGIQQGDEIITSRRRSLATVTLNETFFFHNLDTNIAYVYDNGIISLGGSFSSRTIPLPLSNLSHHILAPYWADVDTQRAGNIFLRQTSEPSLLARATREVQSAYPTSSDATIKKLLIVTWDSVGYDFFSFDKVNTFQCVLATNEFESFVIFLYDDIQWTTGDSSGGVRGLYGNEAVAGITAGDGVNFMTIPGSLTPDIINIDNTSNVGVPGVWLFKTGTVNVSIVNETPGMFAAENNNSFISFVGSVLNLTCSIASTPVANSEFRWKCSSGCLAGMESGQTISITVQQSEMIVCSYAVDSIEYDSDPVQIHVPVNDFVPSISLEPVVYTVGQQQAIICMASLIPGENVNNSALLTWVVPDHVDINDDRVTVMPTTINGSDYSSILYFDYIMETDVGSYTCNIASSQNSFALSVDLQDLIVPRPTTVRLTAPAIQNFRESLTLVCNVAVVRGITSGLTILWIDSRVNEVRRTDNPNGNLTGSSVVYRDHYFISALTSEDRYYCRAVINVTSYPQLQDSIQLQLTSPNAAPSNFRNISKTSTTITFQWDRLVLFQYDRRITWYVITCSAKEEITIVTVNVTGSNTMGTVSDLHPFTYYNCSVYAVTEFGGPSSHLLTVQTDEAVPSAPYIISVTAIDSYSVHVTWRAPTEANGLIAYYTISYNIDFREDLNLTMDVPFNGETTQSFNITGLSPYQLIAVTMTAINGAGKSNSSNEVSSRTNILDFMPSILLEPAVHSVGQGQAIVCTASLIPGEDVNNSLVFTWVLPDGVNTSDDRTSIMPTIVNGSDHTSILQFDYLMESDVGTYTCDIMSNKSSIPQSVVLQHFIISNPNINLTAPAVQNFMESLTLTCEVTTVRGITSRVTIIWTSLDNEVGRVENAIGNNSVDSLVVYRDQFFISALTSEDRYDCRAVINSTSQPQNVASIRLELTSPRAAPSRFISVNRTSTAATFQWDAPLLSQSNSNITWYVITCSDLRDHIVTANVTGNNTIGIVTGLHPYTTYDCSVYAVTIYGGPSSDYIRVQTLEAVPSAPVITAVTVIDSQSVLVTWMAPAEPNGVITGYTVTYNAGGFSNVTVNVNFTGEMTQSFNITGLSTYQLITVTITATNGAGRSNSSNPVSGRTMELAPGVVEFHVSSLMTTGQVEVSWSPPRQPNGVITSYEVIYSVYESSIITTSGILSNTTNIYSIKNLEPGVPYQATVVAFTNAGRGSLNDYIVFFSEELIPGLFPTNINYTRFNMTSIYVMWTPLSLFEAQGFPLYQVILSEPSTNGGTTSDLMTTNNSFAIFANLSIDQQYSLVVGVSTGNNRSSFVYSDPVIVPMLTGGNNGATVIGGSIGGMVLIAVIMAIIF